MIKLVAPCCGKPLKIKSLDDVCVEEHHDEFIDERWYSINVACCAEDGNGMYATRELAEADLDRYRKLTMEESIRQARIALEARFETERQDLEYLIDVFREDCYPSEPEDRGYIFGYSEACGVWN